PYGSEPFGLVGAGAELTFDTRDEPANATRGALLVAGASVRPAIWGVEDVYGDVHATAAIHLGAPLPLRPSLALRAQGRHVFGRYPFHAAAFVGGPTSLRGFPVQRFAGDAGVNANAELRLRFGSFFFVLPGEWGAFALADTGRVWIDGERSRTWHAAGGGGMWFAYVDPNNTVTVSAVRGEEGTNLYVTTGFLF
ncbi:MAG TPA: BamA/TamA family outer membrane protein, partial [Anaeromyxobacteraceae bacterium]|nr:BamA/TamA family outer membrane protein [Anaeromyxobacteraceae bacterium]